MPKSHANEQKLQKLIQAFKKKQNHPLNEEVAKVKDTEASEINRSGPYTQIKFLINYFMEELKNKSLDEEVYEVKNKEAGDIIESGPEDQIRYLMNNGYSLDDLEGLLNSSIAHPHKK